MRILRSDEKIVLGQVRQRHKTYLLYLWRAGLRLSGLQAASQRFEAITGRTPEEKVQPVGSGFLGNVG